MSAASWLLWLILTAVALSLSIWHYRRREAPGRGRALLALLRGLALGVLLLLVFNPELPAGAAGPGRGTQVLLDASLSMSLPVDGGATRWERGVEQARRRAGDLPVLLFGDQPRPVAAAALAEAGPVDGRSRLLPALQAAAEAGVRRVIVITDGGIEDADAVRRWAPRLGLEVEPVAVGGPVANRSLVEVTAPPWVQAGQPATLEFAVAGGSEGDSLGVTARRDGRIVGRTRIAAAGAGRLSTG